MKVRDIMTQPVVTVPEDTSLEQVARTMLERRIGCVLVVDETGELSGILTESDFAARSRGFPFSTFRWPQVFGQWLPREGLEQIYAAARTMTAREVMTTDVVTVTEDDGVEVVVKRMVDRDLHRIPVVRDGVPVGIVSRHNLLRLMFRMGPETPPPG
jgi:CBS domain-containing protein